MTTIIFRIHLNEPALLTMLEGDPNAAVSYPYIPGSVLRGMLIGLFIKMQRQQYHDFKLDAAGEWQSLFFSPQTRYLNAYPLIDDQRALPIPATWTLPKYGKAAEFITDSAIDDGERPATVVKTKSVSGFTRVSKQTAMLYKPLMVINVHTARARLHSSEQQVFRYEALAEGQTFVGAVLCDNAEHAPLLEQLLNKHPHVVIGGSRTAGYGSATISQVTPVEQWAEVDHKIGKEVILTFLSDALLQDDNGSYIPTPQTLETCLAKLNVHCQVEPINMKTTWIGGFNRKWGLPLPQTIAVERGSVVRLKSIRANAPWKELIKLISEGIGNRREDGFGRVALGWQQHSQLLYEKYSPQPVKGELSAESKALWNGLRHRIRDQRFEDQIAGVLSDKQFTIYGSISRTQLSRLRSVIANALRQAKPETGVVNTFLEQISGKAAGRQFDNARISNKPLSEWLKSPDFGDLLQNVQEKDSYILRMVDSVLERAYRERDKQAQQGVK